MCYNSKIFQNDDVVDVNTGELKSAKCNGILRSVAIGSCIVVACYDSLRMIGVMAHIMLPGKAPDNAGVKTKYADDAIAGIMSFLTINHSCAQEVDICLVGGGNVLKKENDTICKANIESVTSILDRNGFTVCASVLGGFDRKSIRMYIDRGIVCFTRGDEDEQLLWGVKKAPD